MVGLTREQKANRAAAAANAARTALQYSEMEFDGAENTLPDLSDRFGKISDDPEWAYLWMRVEIANTDDGKNIAAQMSGKLAYEYVDPKWMAERHGPHWLIMTRKRASDTDVIRVVDAALMRIPKGLRDAYVRWTEKKTREYGNATRQGIVERLREAARDLPYHRPFVDESETVGPDDGVDGPRGRRPVIDE